MYHLSMLGITDCYTSPSLAANPGSRHGYDICDHTRLNPELGGPDAYAQFVRALQSHQMGQRLDFVSNHMSAHAATNRWWHNVLENGRASPYAKFFDVAWEPLKPELRGNVLLPILGGQYGEVLERGELRLSIDEGRFSISYHERALPIDPQHVTRILRHRLETLQGDLGHDHAHLIEYLSILTTLEHLPPTHDIDPLRIAERQREKEVARERFAQLIALSPRIRAHIDDAVTVFNGTPGQPRSFDPLHELLEAQPYRVAYWRTALHEINYRRFFDINTLIGLRSETDRRVRDLTLNSLRDALRETIACFPIYRAYVSRAGWTPADEQTIDRAVTLAQRRNPAMERSIFTFLRRMLLPTRQAPDDPTYEDRLAFAMQSSNTPAR